MQANINISITKQSNTVSAQTKEKQSNPNQHTKQHHKQTKVTTYKQQANQQSTHIISAKHINHPTSNQATLKSSYTNTGNPPNTYANQ